jgi:hypothetical protein
MCVGVRAREQESERARERESERARERESERARVSERASESNRMKEVVVEKFYAQALTLLSCASSRTRSRSCISRFASSVLTTPMSAGMCFFYVWGLNWCVRARACACMCMHVHACACCVCNVLHAYKHKRNEPQRERQFAALTMQIILMELASVTLPDAACGMGFNVTGSEET